MLKVRIKPIVGSKWIHDCLVTYIENDIFNIICNEELMQRFQNIKTHRGKLNKLTLRVAKKIVSYIYMFLLEKYKHKNIEFYSVYLSSRTHK